MARCLSKRSQFKRRHASPVAAATSYPQIILISLLAFSIYFQV
jgi:hypothetical protein